MSERVDVNVSKNDSKMLRISVSLNIHMQTFPKHVDIHIGIRTHTNIPCKPAPFRTNFLSGSLLGGGGLGTTVVVYVVASTLNPPKWLLLLVLLLLLLLKNC